MISTASSFFNALRVKRARNLLCSGTFPGVLSKEASRAQSVFESAVICVESTVMASEILQVRGREERKSGMKSLKGM